MPQFKQIERHDVAGWHKYRSKACIYALKLMFQDLERGKPGGAEFKQNQRDAEGKASVGNRQFKAAKKHLESAKRLCGLKSAFFKEAIVMRLTMHSEFDTETKHVLHSFSMSGDLDKDSEDMAIEAFSKLLKANSFIRRSRRVSQIKG